MKRIIIMLLIACSAITTMSADPTAAPQKKPANVIATLNAIIQKFGMNEGQIFSVNRNPNTGIMESSTKIVPFSCPTNDVKNDDVLNAVSINFQKEEPLSYQFQHIQPGSNENIYLMVIDNDGKSNNVRIRSNKRQEMWMMCTKNPENPQLRDAYAVTWELSEDKQKTVGTVYMITSLRPDVYVKNLETSKKTFKIEGRVDANIKDSLYNIYIANTAEELENIGDDDYVACVPVINKRFEWQTELDHPVVGRLRCIFPDGELCSAWINLDFVPGETYRITVHNGYYDEDQDYERRVGRQSGKSLLNERQSRGIDDVVVDDVVADDVAIDTIPGYSDPVTPRQSSKWEPTPEQMMQIEAKGMALKANMDAIKATYASLETYFKMKSLTGTDLIFAQITKLNKELDAKFQDFIKYLKGLDVPPTEIVEKNKAIGEVHKEILKFYTEQNQGFTEMYKEVGVLTKAAQKTQKYINGLTEKYLKEMSKAVMGAK
ncbi:MAG: hypothetical protein II864_03575 [Prevotella sp.]|nr:hypothetical protein [Prevotella sp.]